MIKVTYNNAENEQIAIPAELLKNKRHLTKNEIAALEKNLNSCDDASWRNVYVDEQFFDASLIRSSSFSGFVIIGKLRAATLKYHDLELETGIYRSKLINVATGDDNVICNVAYLENYRLGNTVMLFNIQEMSCTHHAKFGNGVLKNGEPESNRIWIDIANENGGRAVLPFETMIPADAYVWSRYREDEQLMKRFFAFTERGNDGGLGTYGIVESNVVIKNTTLLKDAKIGECTYIKGAFKLKNITVLSSPEEPSQIGEGVEMVNGIMGYGSRIFYQAVAVRFVIGRNCQLKYGARLLNSVLGDNSTISCCEILNNLLFPFHEQHHNSSFLIASTIMGQSNIASGATIGSNHNSRSPDGELIAHRGFWPGLASDFKHNSKFASFVLVAKGSYQYELDIPYPFSLVALGENGDSSVHIIPAWWFMYDMFAIVRNQYKFKKRDKRTVKVQHIETNPFAPDTMQELLTACERIIDLTASALPHLDRQFFQRAVAKTTASSNQEKMRTAAKLFLEKNHEADFTLRDEQCQKKYGATIFKPAYAYWLYRRIVKYFAAREIVAWCADCGSAIFSHEEITKINSFPLFTVWCNIGGQVMPEEKVNELLKNVKSDVLHSWEDVHAFYNECESQYKNYKARYAVHVLELLYNEKIINFTKTIYDDIVQEVIAVSNDMYNESVASREKDYTDCYRKMVYRNDKEMAVVLGTLDSNDFLQTLKDDTESFNKSLQMMFGR
ncbi:MAG: DUF4954 family protein [Treponema sp.]|nr:DUF4954 family protein [Treponema sp.]